MPENKTFTLKDAIKYGLLAGLISLFISTIGMVELFHKRQMVSGWLSMGQFFLFLTPAFLSYLSAQNAPQEKKGTALLYGAVTGFFASIPVIFLGLLGSAVNLREYLVNVSPKLINEILAFNQPAAAGAGLMILVMTLVGLVAAILHLLPDQYQDPVMKSLMWTAIIATFSEIINDRLRAFFGRNVAAMFFKSKALLPGMAIILFLAIAGLYYWSNQKKAQKEAAEIAPTPQKDTIYWVKQIGFIALLLVLPLLLGTYLSEVATTIGLYIIMGLGLNIVVGFAGLLDLGYVAFFAIGAYVMGIMTSTGAHGLVHTNFWLALPVSMLTAMLAGIILGTPVLRLRGDYLAIVTLGFGEIIRVLANSDLLKPIMGGAQGVLNIPRPQAFGYTLSKPEQIYYIVLAGILLAWFLSVRLQNSRLGRQWMAMREDEDVAEAMGINLISTKLLAFAIGAGLSGLAGGIFAAKLTSIFPHSFNLIISINILSLIIVGGMGSLPGVVVGAIALVGLPELLREFAEYRMLMYGALLVAMMLLKPEGLWPSSVVKRELLDMEEFENNADEVLS